MQKTLLLIINPHAGRATIRNWALDIIDVFVRHDYRVTVFTTQKPGDPTRLVMRYGQGFDRIVCCGGDGTVNESLNGLMTLEHKPEFSVIPVGVTNDYAYSLAIPSAPDRAALVAATGYPFAIDVGLFQQRYFAYVAAFGFITDVTWSTPQEVKNNLGFFAYIIEAAKRMTTFKDYHLSIEYDGGVLEGDYIVGLISNSISIAGLRTAYTDALLDDGVMEIALIKRPARIDDLQDFLDILLNVESTSSIDSEFLQLIRTKKVTVTCTEPLSWTIDGERGGDHLQATLQIERQAIHVIAGRDMSANSVSSISDRGDPETKLI